MGRIKPFGAPRYDSAQSVEGWDIIVVAVAIIIISVVDRAAVPTIGQQLPHERPALDNHHAKAAIFDPPKGHQDPNQCLDHRSAFPVATNVDQDDRRARTKELGRGGGLL